MEQGRGCPPTRWPMRPLLRLLGRPWMGARVEDLRWPRRPIQGRGCGCPPTRWPRRPPPQALAALVLLRMGARVELPRWPTRPIQERGCGAAAASRDGCEGGGPSLADAAHPRAGVRASSSPFALQPSRRRASCPTLLARGSHKNRVIAIIIMIIIMIISTIVRIVMLATPSCALHRRGSRGRRCTVQLSGWRIFFQNTGSAARSESAESQTAQSTTFSCEG